MPINPTARDIGRRVSLRRSGAPPLVGVLREVLRGDNARSDPFAMVKYPDMGQSVATYLNALEWADEQLL